MALYSTILYTPVEHGATTTKVPLRPDADDRIGVYFNYLRFVDTVNTANDIHE
jgi:hypothetical protein